MTACAVLRVLTACSMHKRQFRVLPLQIDARDVRHRPERLLQLDAPGPSKAEGKCVRVILRGYAAISRSFASGSKPTVTTRPSLRTAHLMPSPSSRSRSARRPPIWVRREERMAYATPQSPGMKPHAATTSTWEAQTEEREGTDASTRCHTTRTTASCRTENTCSPGNSHKPADQARQLQPELSCATEMEPDRTCKDQNAAGASLPPAQTYSRHEGLRPVTEPSIMSAEPAPYGIAVGSSNEAGQTRKIPFAAAQVKRVPPAPPPARRSRACSSPSPIRSPWSLQASVERAHRLRHRGA